MGSSKEERLGKVALFKNFDADALASVASMADSVDVDEGRTLIAQGIHHSELYVIEAGTATVEVDGETVAEIPEGELFGELGFFINEAASATVKAKTAMTVLIIPYNRFGQLLEDNPSLLREIATDLAARLYHTDERLN